MCVCLFVNAINKPVSTEQYRTLVSWRLTETPFWAAGAKAAAEAIREVAIASFILVVLLLLFGESS